LDKDPRRARFVAKRGVTVTSISGTKRVKIPVTADAASIGRCDLVLIAVKSYDTEAAAKSALPLLGGETLFLTLQNGLGNFQKIATVVGKENVLAGITSQGANLLSSGRVVHAGVGDTWIGELSGKLSVRAGSVASLLSSCGIPARASRNIESLIWGKLVINAGINPLTVILQCRNGQLLQKRQSRELLHLLVEEAASVARRKGIRLPYRSASAQAEKVASLTGENISSMLQDFRRVKHTEIDFINGAVVREGKKCSFPTPFNQFALLLVKALEREGKR
jgi:2-dehydropantoate 2-reductase